MLSSELDILISILLSIHMRCRNRPTLKWRFLFSICCCQFAMPKRDKRVGSNPDLYLRYMLMYATVLSCVRFELISCRHPRGFGPDVSFQAWKCRLQHNSESFPSNWRRLMFRSYNQQTHVPFHRQLLWIVQCCVCAPSLYVTRATVVSSYKVSSQLFAVIPLSGRYVGTLLRFY